MVGFHPLFGIRTTTLGDVSTVHVLGEIDLATIHRFRAALTEVPAGVRRVVCDLTPVSFFACCGLTALVAARDDLARRGVAFEIVATSRVVLRPIALTGLFERLPVRQHLSIVDDPPEFTDPIDDGKVGG